jgi:hypothetical protein
MYLVHIGSLVVEVATIEELREIVREFASQVDSVQNAVSSAPSAKRRKAVPSRGTGPARLWAMAEWYGAKKGIKKDEARSLLSKMREADEQAYKKIESQFDEANK